MEGRAIGPAAPLPAVGAAARVAGEDGAAGGDGATVRVWDPLVRVFHWSLATTVLTAYFVTQDDKIHENAGYLALGLVGLRLVWGFVGTRYALFSEFVRRPAVAIGYLRDLTRGRARRYLGHNPAGGWSILALLLLVAVVAISGILMNTDRFWGDPLVEDIHNVSANVMMGVVILHLCGVLASSFAHKENLVIAMISGRKRRGKHADPSE